jgi:hypothetical protein
MRAGATHQLERVGNPRGSGKPGETERITDGAVSPDAEWIVLRTRGELTFHRAAELMKGNWREARSVDLSGVGEAQGEGVALGADGIICLAGEGGGKSQAGTFARFTCAPASEWRRGAASSHPLSPPSACWSEQKAARDGSSRCSSSADHTPCSTNCGRSLSTWDSATSSREDDDDTKRKAILKPTGIDADAAGEAEVEFAMSAPAVQEVEFSVSGLQPGASFTFVIDGQEVATATADRAGKPEAGIDVNMPGAR